MNIIISDEEKKSMLNKIRDWKELHIHNKEYIEIWRLAHALAEDNYLPAKDFFIECLDDKRWWFRQDCVSLLGFHYKLSDDETGKIQELLQNDPNENVRMTAALALGNQLKLPNHVLIKALEIDQDYDVREGAFIAILQLLKVPYPIISRELRKLKEERINPSINEAKKILLLAGINPSLDPEK